LGTGNRAPELLAAPVAKALSVLPFGPAVLAAAIDPELADTAAFCQRYAVAAEESANCVIVAGRRGDAVSYAACLLLATTRLDVNGVVRARLGARKASFASLADATVHSGMEYGGITAIGLPDWPVLIDAAVIAAGVVVLGSGIRGSKLALDAGVLTDLPSAEVIDGLAG